MSDSVTYKPSAPWPAAANDADYGTCLACMFDLEGGTSTGRLNLAKALARRLITEQGTLIDDPDYGYDLTAFFNAAIDARMLSEIATQVAAQFRRDDRVADASCSVSFANGVLIVAATVVDKVGPFPLTLAVNDVTVSILTSPAQLEAA